MKKKVSFALLALTLIVAPVILLAAPVAANEVIHVVVDIKPGSDPNALNPGSKGVLPVAILSMPDFDAMQVDPETVRLGHGLVDDGVALLQFVDGVAPLRWNCEDANEDGLMDMVFKFKTQEVAALNLSSLEPGARAWLSLTGHTLDDMPIIGEDMVVIPPYTDS